MQAAMSDIFISYASEDRERAQQLAVALDGRGWSIWSDRNIPFGKSFDQAIDEQIHSARCVLVLWSKISVKSQWVKNEARAGMRRNALVPVMIEQVNLPTEFNHAQTADLTDWKPGAPHSQF